MCGVRHFLIVSLLMLQVESDVHDAAPDSGGGGAGQQQLEQQQQAQSRIFHSQDSFTDTVGMIKFVAYSVVANVIVGVGLVGNLLSLAVLTRPNLKGVMYVYLFGLAASNLLVLLSALPGLYDISTGMAF